MIELDNDVWSDERIERLTQLYVEGWSFRDIGFDIGVSRNSAIGKVHRLKLPPRRKKYVSVTAPKQKKLPPPAKVVIVKKELAAAKPVVDYSCTVADLNDRTCRFPLWPFDAPPYTERWYCGAPDAELSAGRPYCGKHAGICNT